jgi:hypothetical protein
VEFGSGQTLNAAPDFTPLRSDLWQALFNADTPVIPFTFEDSQRVDFQGDQLSIAHEALKGCIKISQPIRATGRAWFFPGR